MSYKPLFYVIFIILLIGIFVPLFVNNFDVEEPEENGFINPIIEFVRDGITIFSFKIDFFFFLGESLKQKFISYIGAFKYIPEIILVPMVIIMITALMYSIIKLLPTT